MSEEEIIMTFGKWCGSPISRVPLPYLRWVKMNCTNISEGLKEAVKNELVTRERPKRISKPFVIPEIMARISSWDTFLHELALLETE